MIWSFLVSLVTGPLREISNDITKAYQSKLAAANDAERIAADERIALLEARKSIIVSSQESLGGQWAKFLYALPCIVYLNKLVIWDKVLGWGSTDPLSPELWSVFMVILGGFFIETTVKGTARIFKR